MPFRKFCYAAVITIVAGGSAMAETTKTVRLVLPARGESRVERVAAVFARQVEQRSAAKIVLSGDAPLRVILAVRPGIGADGFTIAGGPKDSVCISGDNTRGLLYGVGKFLRTSRYSEDGFSPGAWRGTSVPVGNFRGLYCATHFMNYYEAASSEDIRCYIEDIALWGVNALIVAFPPIQYTGFDDPKAQKNLKRLHEMHAIAKALGLKVGLTQCPNQGFTTAPEAIRAKRFPDDLKRRGFHGVNICPSNTAGRRYLKNLYEVLFEEWKTTGLDYLVFWPYDEGGCGCGTCWPWGARGYPQLAQEITFLARSRHPSIKTILSTWCYDTPPAGEWKALASLLEKDNSWLTCIMADAHEDFPATRWMWGSRAVCLSSIFLRSACGARGPGEAMGPTRCQDAFRGYGVRLRPRFPEGCPIQRGYTKISTKQSITSSTGLPIDPPWKRYESMFPSSFHRTLLTNCSRLCGYLKRTICGIR